MYDMDSGTGPDPKRQEADMTKIERTTIANYVSKVGGEKFRITRDGDVHIKGQMPNSIEYGWYLAGSAKIILEDIAEGHR